VGIALGARRQFRTLGVLANQAGIRIRLNSFIAGLRTGLTHGPRTESAADSSLGPHAVTDETIGPAEDGNRGVFREFRFTCHAGTRHYKLFRPPLPSSTIMPVLVMLHGCKQTPDDFALGTRMNDFARRDGFAVVYPAQSRLHNVARCWNWFRPSDQSRGQGEPEIIALLTLDLVKRYAFDPARVYVAGLSAGGAMAAILGGAYPNVYAAVGVHSGVPHGVAVDLASALALMQHGRVRVPRDRRVSTGGTPVIVFHGDADTTVSPRNATEVYARSTGDLGAPGLSDPTDFHESVESGLVPGGHTFTRTRWFGADGVPTSELWVIHESGHAWSGGNPRGSYTDPKGPDASAEMLRFFAAHRLKDMA
jgi:poly(hydroxyalkanoate) depolymerase family esterase